MSGKKSKLENWLDKRVLHKDLVKPYESQYEMNAYYQDPRNEKDKQKDIDIRYYDGPIRGLDEEIDENNEYMDHIYIDPATNRYHTNMLFRELVDYAYENNFDYILHNPETKEKYAEFNLMDKELKTSFYKFCHDYTSKN